MAFKRPTNLLYHGEIEEWAKSDGEILSTHPNYHYPGVPPRNLVEEDIDRLDDDTLKNIMGVMPGLGFALYTDPSDKKKTDESRTKVTALRKERNLTGPRRMLPNNPDVGEKPKKSSPLKRDDKDATRNAPRSGRARAKTGSASQGDQKTPPRAQNDAVEANRVTHMEDNRPVARHEGPAAGPILSDTPDVTSVP